MPTEKLQKSAYPEVKLKDVLGAFWRGVKPQKWLLLVVVSAVIIGNVGAVIAPVFYKKFFDALLAPGDKNQIAQVLVVIIIQVLWLQIAQWVFYRVASFGTVSFEAKSIARLKQQVYDYLMDHSYGFFADNFAGSLVQKVNRFARAFEQLADRILWDVMPLFIKLSLIFVVLFFYNQLIAWVVLAWVMLFLVTSFLFAIWKLKYDIAVVAADSRTTGYLSDTITNQNTIQLFATKKEEVRGFKNVVDEQTKKFIFTWNLSTFMDSAQAGFNVILKFALFFFAIIFWQKGMVSIGIFAMIQSYVFLIIDNTWGFSRVIRHIYQAYADAKEMVEITLLPHEIEDALTAKELNVGAGEIEFKDLIFSFNQTRKVLENINLKIHAGEKIALIGPSGAGKTTFVRLLLRLYSPTAGKILIDGQDISETTQESLRKSISMVPQDPILFHRTLTENITYGKSGATKEEIENAAKLAHCDEFIKDLPFGFETYVGERGIKLSGGERQRVAIARAILKNAPILVLDEATSSLDSNSEMLIQDALNYLMKGRTTIVIAHRLSTIQKMDRIIVVDGGRIIEKGSHKDLLAEEDSLYKKLWELQAGGFFPPEADQPGAGKVDSEESDKEDKNDESEGHSEAKMANF